MSGDSKGPPALEWRYSNYFEIGHNAIEFFLDFGQHSADQEQPHMHTRIITAPTYAKALLVTLAASVQQYERLFGEIRKTADE